MDTFVLRIWTPAEPDGDGEEARLQGVVEHVASGRSSRFTKEAELVELLRGMRAPAASGRGGDGGNDDLS